MVVIDPLRNVPNIFRLKITDRQFHKLNQKIGNNGYAYPGINMKQHPVSDHINRHPAYKQEELGEKNQVNEIYIMSLYPKVDHTLRQEREDEGDKTAQQHPDDNLNNILFIWCYIFKQEFKAA